MNNVVIFDLDGTLIDSHNEIIGGVQTLNCLNLLQQMGCVLAICTGRLDHDIVKISEKYNLNMTHRISQNGAVVYNDEYVKATLLNQKEALSIYEYIKNKDVRIELNTISHRFWKSERDPLFPKELYDSHIIIDDFKDILLYQDAVLFLIVGETQYLEEIEKYIHSHYKNTKAVRTSPTSLEILNSTASKGHAIKTLYPDSHIYAIGDSPNDFDMFSIAKKGYLVSDINCNEKCIKKKSILEALQDIISFIQEG